MEGSRTLDYGSYGLRSLRSCSSLPGRELASAFLRNICLLYLEGQGDLASRLVVRIARVTVWVIGVINLLTKSP